MWPCSCRWRIGEGRGKWEDLSNGLSEYYNSPGSLVVFRRRFLVAISSLVTQLLRAGGSASRTIGDRGATDLGGGVGGSKRRQPPWQLPVGRELGPHWTSNERAFPPLGSHSTNDRGRHE